MLAAADDPGHCLDSLGDGPAQADRLHRLAHVGRREAVQDLRCRKEPRRRVRPQGEKVDPQLPRALASPQPPQLPHAELSVASDLALVDAGDLDLHRQVRAHPLHEGVGGGFSLHERRPIRFRAFADVERAVGLQPGIGRVAAPAEAGGADALRRAAERIRGEVHEVLDDPGQIVMEARRGHQGDEAAHWVEGHPAEMAVPVDGGELGDGAGVGPQDVDGGAERPLVHGGGRSVHGGYASGVDQRAGRRKPPVRSVSDPAFREPIPPPRPQREKPRRRGGGRKVRSSRANGVARATSGSRQAGWRRAPPARARR